MIFHYYCITAFTVIFQLIYAGYDISPLVVGLSLLAVIVISLAILICFGSCIKICYLSSTDETGDLIRHRKTCAVTTSFLTGHHGITGSSHPSYITGHSSGSGAGGRRPTLDAPGDVSDLPSYGAVLASGHTQTRTSVAPPLYATVVNVECEQTSAIRNKKSGVSDLPPPPYPGT